MMLKMQLEGQEEWEMPARGLLDPQMVRKVERPCGSLMCFVQT